MRNYQRKRNPYRLPDMLYRRIKLLCMDYDRMSAVAREETGTVADRARENCKAIDAAIGILPPEYREGVEQNIKRGKPFPTDAGMATYARQKAKCLYEIALMMGEARRKS